MDVEAGLIGIVNRSQLGQSPLGDVLESETGVILPTVIFRTKNGTKYLAKTQNQMCGVSCQNSNMMMIRKLSTHRFTNCLNASEMRNEDMTVIK